MRNESEASTSNDLTRQVASLRALARSLVRDESRAEDLVQDTLVVALERPPRSAGSVRGWLATVARHLALDRARGERRRADREHRVAREEVGGPPADPIERLEVEREVLDAVQALREPYRTTVFLRFWEGLEPAAISLKLGVPVKTVKSRLSRALEDLRARLDTKFEGGRSRWMGALLPIAFPSAPAATGGSGFAPAGIAGGAWIVKKVVIAVAAVILVVLGWRAMSAPGRAERSSLASPGGIALGLGAPAEPEPTRSFVVEEPHVVSSRTAALSAVPDVPAETRGDVLVTLLHADGTPAVDYSIDVRCLEDPAPRDEYLRRRTDAQGRAELAGLYAVQAEIYVDRGARFPIEVVAGERREIELRLQEKLTVEGRVVGPDGGGVGGAEIWVEGTRWISSRPHRTARTAPDGSFRVGELGEDAEIGARARGFSASYQFEVAALPLGPNGSRQVVLELARGGAEIGGRVVDPAGNAVAGALVKIGERGGGIVDLPNGLRASIPDPVPVTSDADGRFTYAGDLQPGVHDVTVSARGWPLWRGHVEAVEGAKGHVDVVLAEPAKIEGRVVDASGAPVAGARVVAAVEHRGGWYFEPFPTPRAKTDADGKFRLDWIAPGQQELNASLEGRPELGKAKLRAKCAAGQTTSVELVLDPGLTITGRIVDREGQPVARWTVRAKPDPYGFAYPRQSDSDEEGRFLLANLDGAHRYDLAADPKNVFSIPSRGTLQGVLPGARDVEIVVESRAEPDARVRGRIVGEDGRVPVDLRVVYYPEGGDTGGYIDFDPDTGKFEEGPLLAGRYELRVYRGGQTVFRTEVFDLAAGETRDVGVLSPGALGKLELVLKGLSEKDLEHARPWLNRDGHATEEFTLESGVFRSRTITPGTWTITLHHDGWFLRKNQVEVRPDETTRVELTPERGYETSVFCSFADPEAKWSTLASKAIDERGETIHVGATWFPAAMEKGKVRLHGLTLPAGRFVVEATTDSGLKGSVTLDVGPASAAAGAQEIVLR
ncbi:MAG: sigma-70 family RNA polymerase sigma factor [Planctomycetota bacterium]